MSEVTIVQGGQEVVTMKFPTQAELSRRNAAIKQSQDDVREQAAVIYMANWMKRKGVTLEQILSLGVWSEGEQQHISKIYKYSY